MQDSVSGQTGMIEILSGENNLDLDVGVVAVGTIAGTVWQDSQYDGIYNRKESGLSGATIELVNPADGQTVHMTQTDENGRYALDFGAHGRICAAGDAPGWDGCLRAAAKALLRRRMQAVRKAAALPSRWARTAK